MEGGGGGGTTRAAMRAPTELQISKKWRHSREAATASPERNKIWTEPSNSKISPRRVPVVYYLSRNGQLEHPHFMEVPLSSSDGLYLRDVIHRLNLLRGTGIAAIYSWSSKRAYKNGFVWQDLTENDFVYPSHGSEYVLKGSELLHDIAPSPSSSSSRPLESVSFRSPKLTEEQSEDGSFPTTARRRNQSWSSIDLQEYKVYRTESNGDSTRKPAADAATQTDDRRRRARRQAREEAQSDCEDHNVTTELSRDEISPPPSDSSPETLETLMKADKRLALSGNSSGGKLDHPTAVNIPSGGRTRASAVLMQLISCGSFSFKDCGATYLKDHEGLSSLIGHYKGRLPGGPPDKTPSDQSGQISSLAGLKLEDKEYFSGSLIETKKEAIPTLKRSSSYNADGSSSQRQLRGRDSDDDQAARTMCIPMRFKSQSSTVVVTTVKSDQTTTTATCSNSAAASNTHSEEVLVSLAPSLLFKPN